MANDPKFPLPFEKLERDLIIANILLEVDSIGSSRVGYHAEKVLGYQHYSTPHNILSKIEGTIIQDKRYKSRPYTRSHGDYEIIKNPEYKKQTWEEKHPFWDRVRTGVITFAFTLIAGVLIYIATKGRENQDRIRESRRVDDLYDSLAKIRNDIKGISTTPPKTDTGFKTVRK